MEKLNSRQGKTVVITGGTRGIGAGIAREFYARGYAVVLAARHDNGSAKKLGPRAFFVKTDVTRDKDQARLAREAVRRTGSLDVFVNGAGLSRWAPIGTIDPRAFKEMLAVNLEGVFWGCKAAAGVLAAGGVIINVASLAGRRGSANNSAYCAAKFGVIGLTQALAKELGPRGIRVNAVCPVYVPTDGVLKALAEKVSPAAGKNVAAYLKDFALTQAALKRLPTAAEVGGVCVFLASDAASAVTGQAINVDCGVMPQ